MKLASLSNSWCFYVDDLHLSTSVGIGHIYWTEAAVWSSVYERFQAETRGNSGTTTHKGQVLIGPISIMFAHVLAHSRAVREGSSAISKSREVHCLFDFVPKYTWPSTYHTYYISVVAKLIEVQLQWMSFITTFLYLIKYRYIENISNRSGLMALYHS
jgi:hypothetical protein